MKRLPLAMAFVLLAGARCAGASADDDVPALLVEPSEETRAELRAVLAEALGQPDFLLAPDAFTRESVLVLERSARGDLTHPSPGGRDLERPEHVRLVLARGTCYVVRPRTGERWPLAHAHCRPSAE